MRSHPFWPTLAMLILVITAISPGVPAAVAVEADFAGTPALLADSPDRYIVQLADKPLALYDGGVAGLAPTMPAARGEVRLDPASPASVAYYAYLDQQHAAQIAAIEAALNRPVEVVFHYRTAFNGLAITLTGSEAVTVRGLAGVERVEREEYLQLLTDNGPKWMNADDVWSGDATASGIGSMGEGTVAGIIDTGVNSDHPSFADIGGDGYDHTNPRVVRFGVCAVNVLKCNDKLIGMYDFTGTGEEDDNGHGSHTASTVAGNVVDATLIAPTITLGPRRISGVAPHANIISYKACTGTFQPIITDELGSCPATALFAAIDQATADVVDVINFSIGGGSQDPWIGIFAQPFFGTQAAGVFVAASAGNSGPNPQTIGNPSNAPWLMSVGASTHDRRPTGTVTTSSEAGTGPTFSGMTVSAGLASTALIDARTVGRELCGTETAGFTAAQAAQITGKIVICTQGLIGRVQKGVNVKSAGGLGMILVSQPGAKASVVADTHVLPTVMISEWDGQALREWLAGASAPQAALSGTTLEESASLADRMAYFSSRGPDLTNPYTIKPDVTAPGVAIWAAFNSPAGSTAPEYNIIQGTSMSSPHAAGAAVLVRALNPNWTPDHVKSALMSTGFTSPKGGKETQPVLKEDHATAADPFDFGGGRVDVSRAVQAGFALNETVGNYQAANPALGGDPRQLNLASLMDQNCRSTCSWSRTVASTQTRDVTYTVSVTSGPGFTLSVSPSTFLLPKQLLKGVVDPLGTQPITITATNTALAPGKWEFGEIVFTPNIAGMPAQRFPVAVKAQGGNVEPPCTIEEGVRADPNEIDVAPQHNIREVGTSGLYPTLGGQPTPNIVLRMKVTTLDPLPPDSHWRIAFRTPGQAANLSWFVQMLRGTTGEPTFVYGTLDSVENTFSILGAPDGGGFDADGTIRITIDASKVGNPGAGETLSAITGAAGPAVPGTLTTNSDSTSNATGPTNYTLAGCPDSGPTANDDSAFTEPGRAVTIDVLANDSHTTGDAFSLQSVSAAPNGTTVANANGTVTYTPNAGFRGTDTFTYTITDSQDRTSTATVRVAVQPSNCVIPETVVTTDPAEINVAPQHNIREIAMAGVFPNFGGTGTPVLNVRMKVDSLAPLPPTSHWRVAFAPPGAPSGTTYYVQMVRGADGPPSFVYGTLAAGSFTELGATDAGSFTADGNIRWTIATSKILGPKAGDTLEVVQGAAGAAVPGTLTTNSDSTTINATARTPKYTFGDCTNVGPFANADSATTTADTAVKIDVLANDSHLTGEPLTVTSVSAPANGTAARNADNTVTYTPNAGFTGVDGFTYTITDPQGRTASASVSVTVAPFCPTTGTSYDFESGAEGWSVETATNDLGEASPHWQRTTDILAKSGTTSFASDAAGLPKDDRLISPSVRPTTFGRISFWHRFGFEQDFDGGVLEVSTDAGRSWRDVTDPLVGGRFLKGGYNGTITTDTTSGIAGRPAWTGGDGSEATGTMTEVVVDIGTLGGQDALFRWRLVTDPLFPGFGWWVDDVTFSGLGTDCNEPPVANDDAAVTQEGSAVTIAVLANDTDPDGDDLTVSQVGDPANGTAAINADGTITYTPDDGFVGTETFTYTASDGEWEDTAVVTVTVEERPNTAPVANSDSATTPRNTAVTIAVLANDHDAEGDALTVTAVTQPANGRATLNADGTVTYAPNTNFSGKDTFTYDISDGHGGAATGAVTVNVGEPGAPIACFKHNPKTPEADSNTNFDARCSSDNDTPSDQLTYEWDFQSDGVVDATGSRVHHRFGAAGTYTVTLRVTDSGGKRDVLKKDVTVIPTQ